MSTFPPFPFSAAILAGGRSSRMGRDKAFLPLAPNGEPLINHQAALLRRIGCGELIISGRLGVDYGVPGSRVVTDTMIDSGPLAGLVALLTAARHPWVMAIAVDLPHLTTDYLAKLLAAGAGVSGVVPLGAGGYEPLVGLYPQKMLPLMKDSLAAGRLSLQPLLHTAVAEGLLRPLAIEAHEQVLFTNWNTPADCGNA